MQIEYPNKLTELYSSQCRQEMVRSPTIQFIPFLKNDLEM